MTSQEFTAWVAFDQLQPLNRSEVLLAQLYTLTLNVHRDQKAHPRPFTVEDVLLTPAAREAVEATALVQDWNEEIAAMRSAYREKGKPN